MTTDEGDLQILIFAMLGIILTAAFIYIFYRLIKTFKKEDAQLRAGHKQVAPTAQNIKSSEILSAQTVANTASPSTATTVNTNEAVEVDLKQALRKTEENLFGRIRALFGSAANMQHLEEIEEILYTSDLGPQTVQRLMGAIEKSLSKKEKSDYEMVKQALKQEMISIFESASQQDTKIKESATKPTVLMIVGVNGAGKTTSIGKISAQFAGQGKKVLVAAGDTFRAAAGGQLKVWTDRAQVEIFSPEGVTDPSAVAFDAISKAKAQGYDIVIVDTAGRLHTQANLMEELKKMKRVMSKVIEDAPHEVLIVLDANSGQNALIQAREFHAALQLTGVILTKMDGTAKGGVAIGVAQELKIPIKLIGVGERIQDLRTFSHQQFVESILG